MRGIEDPYALAPSAIDYHRPETQQLFLLSPPHDGAMVPYTASKCGHAECLGPPYCMHAHNVTACRGAVYDWRVYAIPAPPCTTVDVAAVRAALCALTAAGGGVREWVRCGASAELLALAGVRLGDALDATPCARTVSIALQLDWQRLHVLRFCPALLVRRNDAQPRRPVIALADLLAASMTPQRCGRALLRDYAINFSRLRLLLLGPAAAATAVPPSLTQLAAYDCTAPLLARLGMSGVALARALHAECDPDAPSPGEALRARAALYVRFLKISHGLLLYLLANAPRNWPENAPAAERRAMAALVTEAGSKKGT